MDMDRQTEQSDKELFGPGDSIRLPAAPRVPALGGQETEVHHTQIYEERKKDRDNFYRSLSSNSSAEWNSKMFANIQCILIQSGNGNNSVVYFLVIYIFKSIHQP